MPIGTAALISTERLDLVALAPEDADEMVAVLGDDRLYAFIGGGPPTPSELRARYRRLVVGGSADGSEQWHNWIVRRRTDGRAVGTVQATIVDQGRAASIAWVIGMPWQVQGFATEAARALVRWLEERGVTTLTANIHPDHHASAAVASRVGLTPTADIENGERVWRTRSPGK